MENAFHFTEIALFIPKIFNDLYSTLLLFFPLLANAEFTGEDK